MKEIICSSFFRLMIDQKSLEGKKAASITALAEQSRGAEKLLQTGTWRVRAQHPGEKTEQEIR
jgi:hypothetical protein